MFCHATSPLGKAVACPEPLRNRDRGRDSGCYMACGIDSDTCHTVYVGHNLLGNELSWLPPPYLSSWFEEYVASNPSMTKSGDDDDESVNNLRGYLETLRPGDPAWCPYMDKIRPESAGDFKEHYAECVVTLQQAVDREAYLTVARRHPLSRSTHQPQQVHDDVDWSHIYASMPVLRTTIIRDPFSWLVSKFFWHGGGCGRNCTDEEAEAFKCDDIELATQRVSPFDVASKEARQGGWIRRYAITYLTYLCGEDCASRYHQGISNVEQMERQAAGNLRKSFAVVGILEDTDKFYDMVSKRVAYVNMSLNLDVHGQEHSSGKGPEQLRCKAKFAERDFQEKLKKASPELAAIDRLYRIGVQVNRFQMEELKRCWLFTWWTSMIRSALCSVKTRMTYNVSPPRTSENPAMIPMEISKPMINICENCSHPNSCSPSISLTSPAELRDEGSTLRRVFAQLVE